MTRNVRIKQFILPALAGLAVGLVSLVLTVQLASASSGMQTDDDPPPIEYYTAQECQECHLDVTNHWSTSPHAHAFDDPVFQDRWIGMGEPGECLTCHTTEYSPVTGEYEVEGISCQSCHGAVAKDHPDAIVPILADTEYCGSCHTTTLGEWHLTGHAASDIGCTDCHDPHSQNALFEVADDMCLNCHEESMGDYLEGIHHEQEIGCVDCHALVIPPEEPPEDGIVPTGHAFTITPATCVACHTDALHAGFSLPGYEEGATAAVENGVASQEGVDETAETAETVEEMTEEEAVEEEQISEEQLQDLEAALASQRVTLIFQGGLVGLVLGGTTAWIVASNVRRGKEEEDNDEEDE